MLFPTTEEVLDLHKNAIEEFGGTHGLREEAALESALIAAQNRAYYENADLAVCAATYAYHLTQAHAFIDGNKRIAAAVAELFLSINDARLELTNAEIVELFLGIAASRITRDEVEHIFVQRVTLTS
ncbi:MAG: type II toxin-antitoxin system death-on-curing family toxin [Blastocatellia bacterium]